MDEDDETGTEASSIGVGRLVIVHTEDSQGDIVYETGVISGIGEGGVSLKVTHRTERVYPELTVGEKTVAEEEVLKLNRVELIWFAWRAGDKLAATRKKADLQKFAVAETIELLEDSKKPYDTLRPLTRTVSTFLPWDRIAKVVSFDEWHEEQQLRPLAASLEDKSDAEPEKSKVDAETE